MAPRRGERRKANESAHSDSTIRGGLSVLALSSAGGDTESTGGQKRRREPEEVASPGGSDHDSLFEGSDRSNGSNESRNGEEASKKRKISAPPAAVAPLVLPWAVVPPAPAPAAAPTVTTPAPAAATIVSSPPPPILTSPPPPTASSTPAGTLTILGAGSDRSNGTKEQWARASIDADDWIKRKLTKSQNEPRFPKCDRCSINRWNCDQEPGRCRLCISKGVPCTWSCKTCQRSMLRAIDSGVVSRVDEEGIRQEEHELREKIRQLEVQLYTTQVELCRASTPATQGAHPQSSSRDDPNDPLHGLTAAEWQKTGDALVELTLENQKLKADNHTLHLRIAQLETGLLEGGRKKRRTTTQVLAAGERSDSRIVAETAGGAAAAGAAGAAVHVTPASNPTAAPTQLTPGQNPYIAVPTGHYNQFTRSTAMTLPGWTQPKGGQILDLTQDHSMQSTQNVQETLSQEDLLNLAQNDPDFLRQLPQRDLDVLMETVQNTPNAYEESGICTLIIGALARNQENAQSGEQEERSDGHL